MHRDALQWVWRVEGPTFLETKRRAVALYRKLGYDYVPAIALYRKLGYDYVRREDGRRLVGDILFGRSVQVTRLRFEKDLRGAAASGEAQGQEVGEER